MEQILFSQQQKEILHGLPHKIDEFLIVINI